MAARNANFSSQYQNFLTESFIKERDARLAWYQKQKALGKEKTKPKQLEVLRRRIEENSKPSDAFLSRVPEKPYEPKYTKKALVEAEERERMAPAKMVLQDMRPVTPEVKKKLFEGITKEGKGRFEYLRQRNEKNPEDKYTFPLLSSWEYGWRLGDVMPKESIKKPKNGRTKIVADTFYNRNGIGVPPVVC